MLLAQAANSLWPNHPRKTTEQPMVVASIGGAKNQLAKSLVAARGSQAPFASALSSAVSALGAPSAAETNQIAAQQNYAQSLSNLQDKLNQLFQSSGIGTSHDIQLTLAADGTVQLANDHPDADQINQVLSEHPELVGMFQSLAKTYQQSNQNAGTAASSSADSQVTLTLSNGQASAEMA
jgi:hypothetical protein